LVFRTAAAIKQEEDVVGRVDGREALNRRSCRWSFWSRETIFSPNTAGPFTSLIKSIGSRTVAELPTETSALLRVLFGNPQPYRQSECGAILLIANRESPFSIV